MALACTTLPTVAKRTTAVGSEFSYYYVHALTAACAQSLVRAGVATVPLADLNRALAALVPFLPGMTLVVGGGAAEQPDQAEGSHAPPARHELSWTPRELHRLGELLEAGQWSTRAALIPTHAAAATGGVGGGAATHRSLASAGGWGTARRAAVVNGRASLLGPVVSCAEFVKGAEGYGMYDLLLGPHAVPPPPLRK